MTTSARALARAGGGAAAPFPARGEDPPVRQSPPGEAAASPCAPFVVRVHVRSPNNRVATGTGRWRDGRPSDPPAAEHSCLWERGGEAAPHFPTQGEGPPVHHRLRRRASGEAPLPQRVRSPRPQRVHGRRPGHPSATRPARPTRRPRPPSLPRHGAARRPWPATGSSASWPSVGCGSPAATRAWPACLPRGTAAGTGYPLCGRSPAHPRPARGQGGGGAGA